MCVFYKTLFKYYRFRTFRGGQETRDSNRDFLGAAACSVAFGSIKVLLGLLASVISLVEDIFEIQRVEY